MIANIVIGAAIFGYAGWTLVQFIKRSKKGKCAACGLQKSCSSQCEVSSINNKTTAAKR